MKFELFKDLFVLELANNHWGSVERGLKIIDDYASVVRFNDMKASIKLQFRDVDNFIHPEFLENSEVRYVDKTRRTKLSWDDFRVLIDAVKAGGMLTMSTPFDEASVAKCGEYDLDIVKIASSDIKDWFLIEAIAELEKPVIASSGGSSLKDLDDLVNFFAKRNIPFALNHCVSLYPSEDSSLELNQIDFLVSRYPNIHIGFSTHEYNSWDYSLMIAYAKGARTFERHIDIDYENVPVSPYCSLPEQVDKWFKAYKKAQEMCGGPGSDKRVPSKAEIKYLEALVRGVYAKRELPAGHTLTEDDVYLAIPLQKGQISCREFRRGEVVTSTVKANAAINIDNIKSPYSKDSELVKNILERGF
jgi:sialic acid synthase SpsE